MTCNNQQLPVSYTDSPGSQVEASKAGIRAMISPHDQQTVGTHHRKNQASVI